MCSSFSVCCIFTNCFAYEKHRQNNAIQASRLGAVFRVTNSIQRKSTCVLIFLFIIFIISATKSYTEKLKVH